MDPIQTHPIQGDCAVTAMHATDGYLIAVVDSYEIRIFSTSGELERTIHNQQTKGALWASAASGRTLVSGGVEGVVRVWDVGTGALLNILPGHTGTVRCIEFSDPSLAISGSRDTTLRIWNLEEGSCSRLLEGHSLTVRCVVRNGDVICSASDDTTIKIWRASTGGCVHTLNGHTDNIQVLAIHASERWLGSGSKDGTVRLWSLQSGGCLLVTQGFGSVTDQLHFRGRTLVSAGCEGRLHVYSVPPVVQEMFTTAHNKSISAIVLYNRWVITGGADRQIRAFDPDNMDLIRDIREPKGAVWKLAIIGHKLFAASCRDSGAVIEMWDLRRLDKENRVPV